MFVHNKGPHLLQREIITESKKYIQEIGKSSSGLHSQFYDIFICNHSFAEMYSLICTGFSGERCGPWAFGFCLLVTNLLSTFYSIFLWE